MQAYPQGMRDDTAIAAPAAPGSAARSTPIRVWIIVVTVSAFGPYLFGGIRTEQLAVYLSAVTAAFLSLTHRDQRDGGAAAATVPLLWSAIVLIATVGVAWTPPNQTSFPVGSSAMAGLDNWISPLAVMVTVAFWCERQSSRVVARTVSFVVVLVLFINSIVSVVATAAGGYSLTPWVEYFWARGDEEGTAVAMNALSNLRYTGLFNQPVEAGICYSLALVCLLYLATVTGRRRPVLLLSVAAFLVVGGMLTVSKVFLFGGLPLFAFLVLRDRLCRRQAIAAGAVAIGAMVIFQRLGGSSEWEGLKTVAALTDPATIGASTLTAGRLGEGSTLAAVTDQMLEQHPWFGLGAAGLSAAYDSSWVEVVVNTGLVGAGLLMVAVVALFVRWFGLRATQGRPENVLGGSVLILAVAASLGMPSFTGNRVSTLIWLLVTCLVLVPRPTWRNST